MDELSISTNWMCDDKNNLQNLVKLIHKDHIKCGIEHVSPEFCICLQNEENENLNPKPIINIKVKSLIKEINVFSEGSLIEVFGVHDEYLCTCVAEFVDDWEGMGVYHAKIVLPNINTCRLKFTRIKEPHRLWVYSLQLRTTKSQEQPNVSFNIENINKLLNNSSQQISEKADKFKKFFEMYTKNHSNVQSLNVQSLLNVINKECNGQVLECKGFLNDCESVRRKENVEVNGNELSVETQYLKSYIDRKFLEMKDELMKCIECKVSELREENNIRFDQIVKLLESLKV